MQTLYLADNLFPLLENGEMKITIRKGNRNIELGKLEFVSTMDENRRMIVDVVETRCLMISDVSDEICKMDGFNGWVDFYKGMKKFYPDLDVSDTCTIIMYK